MKLEIDTYVDILEQSLSKRELAELYFSILYSKYDKQNLKRTIKNILMASKDGLQNELKEKLNNHSKNYLEMIEAISECTEREIILNYNISVLKQLLKEEEIKK